MNVAKTCREKKNRKTVTVQCLVISLCNIYLYNFLMVMQFKIIDRHALK